ncbi:baseplate J/gp47 family protein [Commensalibacter sp. ESL0382]|uniref:baseplate J/gp47 family protein n=1 Tax=Commensalibacter sp. ESL0382 TaxID=2676445 RepID=UPI0012D87020|nr:baseplate J/gp47 family protein [Commensalibacter sp. ESL0382]MUG34060.1 hypothetical protein [Commensalibacter sp. ESL0382]
MSFSDDDNINARNISPVQLRNLPIVKDVDTNIPSLKWGGQSTSDHDKEWGNTGIILPEEQDILAGVIEDFQNAFNNQLKFFNNQNEFLLSTPQGQLATSMAAIISDRNRLLAYYVNQVDPSYATGRMQDGIGRIYFIERIKAKATTVTGICRGQKDVLISAGTKVQDGDGNLYEADQNYIIGEDGTVAVNFVCLQKGPINCPAHSLQMYQLIPGWDNVDNPTEGIIGNNVESQAQFEQRRRQSVALNSVNSVDSIMAALLNLKNGNGSSVCEDVYVIDNDSGGGVNKNGFFLKPHSLFVCVSAPDDDWSKQLIAQTIWKKKPPGCDMNGDQIVVIQDQSGLYSTPPKYTICYANAKRIPIRLKITLARPQFLPKNAVDQIKTAIIKAFTGNDGSKKPRIGSEILASSFYAPVQRLGSWISIITLFIGREIASFSLVQMNIDEMPTLNKDDVEVVFNG